MVSLLRFFYGTFSVGVIGLVFAEVARSKLCNFDLLIADDLGLSCSYYYCSIGSG